MSVDGVKEALLAAVRRRCPLRNNNESSAAARAIRHYLGEDVTLDWAKLPGPRINKIEDAVVAAVQAHYGVSHDGEIPGVVQARITAQFMRRTPSIGSRATGSRRPAGTRPIGGGKRRK